MNCFFIALAAGLLPIALASPPPSDEPREPDDAKLPPNIGAILRDSDLDEFERTHRLVFVFAPSDADPKHRDQEGRFEAAKAGLEDRDVVVISLFEAKGGRVGRRKFDMKDAAALRLRYKVKAGEFAAVLVGKDGAEKARFAEPVAADRLFGIIDAMPMRKREAREQGK